MTSITSPTSPKPSSKISPQRPKANPTRRSTIAPSSKLTSPTPNNTLISKPIAAIVKRTHTLPAEGGVPINAASKFMHMDKNVSHAATPGNTLSSLEQITNRIANNLGGVGEGTENRIAPSYERNFRAGLGDLTRRLSTPNAVKSPASPVMSRRSPASPVMSPTVPSSMMFNEPNSLLKANEWPTSFSDLDAATNSLRSDRTDLTKKSPEKASKAEEGK